MMKSTRCTLWMWLLCAALCYVSGAAARKSRTFSQPDWIASTTSVIRITKVEFTDTATIVSFHEKNTPGRWIRIVKEVCLWGEDGRKYNALRGEGITLGEQFWTPSSGEADFKVLFEPLPRKTRFFDFIEGNISRAFNIYGVHEIGKMPNVPATDDAFVMTPELERQFFTADTACVKGRIEGYSRSQGASTMLFNRSEMITGEKVPLVVDIREDGTFEFRFMAYHPVEGALSLEEKDNQSWFKFYVVPGQTTELLVKEDRTLEFVTTPTGPFGRNHSLTYEGFSDMGRYPYTEQKADGDSLGFRDFGNHAMRRMQKQLHGIRYLAWRFDFTPWERHLAECQVRLTHGMAVFDYEMDKRFTLYDAGVTEQDRQSLLSDLWNPANYHFMREMPCNDVSALVCSNFDLFQNRYQFSSIMAQGGRSPYLLPDSVAKADAALMAIDTTILGSTEPSLFSRLILLRSLASDLDNYGEAPSMYDSICQNRLAYMNRDVLRDQVGRLLEQARRRCTLTYPLPDTEGGRLLRRLTEKYKGKYLMIDFWGMFCGPCRAGIESSEKMREAFRDSPDVDFLFISAEGEGPEENYRKYVDEHLSGEDVVQVSRDDFNRLMELFNFLGIPHYETLDRTGNVIRMGLHYAPEEQFRLHLEHLKKQLEH